MGRAVAARYPGAVGSEEAVYFKALYDNNMLLLDASKHHYVLTFSGREIPRTKAFWSVTLYQNGAMINNPLNRYSIGDRTPRLQYGNDGSLTIYIQHDSPERDIESTDLAQIASPERGPSGGRLIKIRRRLELVYP